MLKINLARTLRPTSLDEIVGHEKEKKDLKAFLVTRDCPHIMLIGAPGIGKNCIAYAFASEYLQRFISVDTENGDRDYLEINASKDRGIDLARGDLLDFVETHSDTYVDGKRCKRVCFCDEFDSTTKDLQLAMRSLMEKCENNCIFILSMNHEEGIKENALFSRCCVFRLSTPPFPDIAEYFYSKAKEVGVLFENKQVVVDIVKHYKGDFRRMLNDCLEALRGYTDNTKKVDGEEYIVIRKEDLYKIYDNESKSIADQVFEAESPRWKFKELWENNNFDIRNFLARLFELFKFRHPKTFAKVDSRLRRGANEMIQISYLFSEIGVK